MPRRDENTFKRKNVRWEARYIKEYDLSGKARYGYCYGRTYTEAKEKASSMKGKKGSVPSPHRRAVLSAHRQQPRRADG